MYFFIKILRILWNTVNKGQEEEKKYKTLSNYFLLGKKEAIGQKKNMHIRSIKNGKKLCKIEYNELNKNDMFFFFREIKKMLFKRILLILKKYVIIIINNSRCNVKA
jgi:hypothetical protein